MKLFQALLISAMFSQSALAISSDKPHISVDRLIELAKDQGLAVAQCRYGLCRDTEDGYYVSIPGVGKDGYYAYDPLTATPSEGFGSDLPENKE